MRPTVAVLGIGAMGRALVSGLLAAGWEPSDISGAVRREARMTRVTETLGIECHLDAAAAVADRDVVVVAVKPFDVPALLETVAGSVEPSQAVVSLAAGVSIEVYESALPGVPVVRAMPNTPALVGEGITGLAPGTHVDELHLQRAVAVLEAVGSVQVLEESLLDAVTAVSGTGPAYVFLLAEALIEAAIREGLPRDVAESFVHQTVRGAGHLLTETDDGAADLRAQVTSPGGTTAAAVHVLEERGFRALVEDAVRAAAHRSRELGAGGSRTD
jgi:pyrroline-5-carboxylate reductase